MDKMSQLEEALMELAELKSALQVANVGTKSWQDKYEHLLYKVYNPQEGSLGKLLLGFQIRAHSDRSLSPAGIQPDDVFDVLSAIDLLLQHRSVRVDWVLVPVFEGDMQDPNYVDQSDLEDGDT